MTTIKFFVENIKCDGCIRSIKNALLKIKGITGLEITIAEGRVCVSGIGVERSVISGKLSALGYPEPGNNSLLKRTKSYISCAAGNIL